MKKSIVWVLVFSFFTVPLWAAPKESKGVNKTSAGERIADETADAVADVLTGEDKKAQSSSRNLPPGLAKKGKVPPGWQKGKKEGWTEIEEKKDSPIKTFIKGLLNQQ